MGGSLRILTGSTLFRRLSGGAQYGFTVVYPGNTLQTATHSPARAKQGADKARRIGDSADFEAIFGGSVHADRWNHRA